MAAQNLVSEEFSIEGQAAFNQGMAGIKGGLPAMVTLQPNEKQELLKVGNSYLPFIDKAHEVLTVHPEIMPGIFDAEEFKKDYKLARDMTPYMNEVRELLEGMEDTVFAARSDAMTGALEIYAAVQQNKDKVPGLDSLAADMASFFKKARKRTTEAAPAK